MSAQPNLQSRILSTLRDQGPLPVKDFDRHFIGIDRGALDCGVNALLRANKVTRAFNMYDLTAEARGEKPKPSEPPNASDELATNFGPVAQSLIEQRRQREGKQACGDCKKVLPFERFQTTRDGNRYPTCRTCMGKRSVAAKLSNSVNGGGEVGAAAARPLTSPDGAKPSSTSSASSTVNGSIAQRSEQAPVEREVVGSSPAGAAKLANGGDAIATQGEPISAEPQVAHAGQHAEGNQAATVHSGTGIQTPAPERSLPSSSGEGAGTSRWDCAGSASPAPSCDVLVKACELREEKALQIVRLQEGIAELDEFIRMYERLAGASHVG